MASEQQYIELYEQARQLICDHSSDVLNSVRDKAFDDFRCQGFPSRKVERYKYTDMEALFAPNYGLNLKRLQIPVDPYKAFRCDVPNLSTSLYFMVNDAFFNKALPQAHLPEGVIIGTMKEYPDVVGKYYAKLAKTSDDAITALNTMLAQDGLLVYVPKDVKVDRAGDTDHVDAFICQFFRAAIGAVTADNNDTVDTVLPADLGTLLLSFLSPELGTSRCT